MVPVPLCNTRMHSMCIIATYIYVILVGVIFTEARELSVHNIRGDNWDANLEPMFTVMQVGDGTYYGAGADSAGDCTLRNPAPYVSTHPSIYATVALNNVQWYNSLPCGACLNITAASGPGNPGSNVLVYVNNKCPECLTGDLDFATNGNDRWTVSWMIVDCPVDDTMVQYLFAGSGAYYIKLQVRNTRYPTKSLSIQQSGNWVVLSKEDDNFWLGTGLSFPVALPLSVRLESPSGDFIYDTITSITNDVGIPGSVQFPSMNLTTPSTTTSGSASTSESSAASTGATTGVATTTGATASSTAASSSTTTKATGTTTGEKPSNIVNNSSTQGALVYWLLSLVSLLFIVM